MADASCLCAVDWRATGTMLQGIGAVLGPCAVLAAAVIGSNTFKRWRQQKLAERRSEQAERILTAAYKVRRLLSNVRSPMMLPHEFDAAEEVLKEQGTWDQIAGGADERKKVATAQAYYNRLNRAKDDRMALEDCQPMARALFGEELEQAVEKLNRQFWSVQVYVDANMRDRNNGADGGEALRKKIDSTLYEGYPSAAENEMDQTIAAQMQVIEATCVPVLRLENSSASD